MNKAPYMNKRDVEDYIKLCSMQDECIRIANNTNITMWSRKLRTIATYVSSIVNDRLSTLDKSELEKLLKRVEKKQVLIYTQDEVKLLEQRLSGKDKNMMVDADAWVTLLKAVDNYICRNCIQGCQVKQCEVRQLLHKSMAPIYNDDPAEGECEYHWDSSYYDIKIDMKEGEK